jgi:hypothetical protein
MLACYYIGAQMHLAKQQQLKPNYEHIIWIYKETIQKKKHKLISEKTLLNLQYQEGNPGKALETKLCRGDVIRNMRRSQEF